MDIIIYIYHTRTHDYDDVLTDNVIIINIFHNINKYLLLRFETPRSVWSGFNDIFGPRVGAAGSSRKRHIYYIRCVYYIAAELLRNVVRIYGIPEYISNARRKCFQRFVQIAKIN